MTSGETRLGRTDQPWTFQPLIRDGEWPHFYLGTGVGCQVVATDASGDGRPHILAVSKLGAFVFIKRQEMR